MVRAYAERRWRRLICRIFDCVVAQESAYASLRQHAVPYSAAFIRRFLPRCHFDAAFHADDISVVATAAP